MKSVQEKFNIGENRNNRKKLAKFRKRLEEEKKGHIELVVYKPIRLT